MKVHNFSPGPAMMPPEVMQEVQQELLDFQGSGMSIMEVSHRSAIFQGVIDQAMLDLRTLMEIPENYEVLFVQGGASTQFAMVPLNLMQKGRVDFLDTGTWSDRAIQEAQKYGETRIVASSKDKAYTYVPEVEEGKLDPDADYFHITTNNTIFGTRLNQIPGLKTVPLVADMSSNILAERYRVEDFGLIYAGAQKNIGPAGLTIVIIRKDLIGKANPRCPKMLDYQTHAQKGSLYNTPPSFAIYLAGKVFQWMLKEGGVAAAEQRNQEKADSLYEFLDASSFYTSNIQPPHRSLMNVCFKTPDPEIDVRLVSFAESKGCMFLKGHRSVGGLRASLYNAMDIHGVGRLLEVLVEFEKQQ